jgi:hypothetical protein
MGFSNSVQAFADSVCVVTSGPDQCGDNIMQSGDLYLDLNHNGEKDAGDVDLVDTGSAHIDASIANMSAQMLDVLGPGIGKGDRVLPTAMDVEIFNKIYDYGLSSPMTSPMTPAECDPTITDCPEPTSLVSIQKQ